MNLGTSHSVAIDHRELLRYDVARCRMGSVRHRLWRAFTLVELLVAIAIGLIILGLAVPALREIKRPPLTLASKDFMEACTQARAKAIMGGRATQIVIRDGGAEIVVEDAPEGVVGATNGVSAVSFLNTSDGTGSPPSFARRFADGIAFESIEVNRRSFEQATAAAVRFFPNGTADQFAGIISYRRGEARRFTVEVMTGLAEVFDGR